MHNHGKPAPPRQVLDVVVIGEALTDVVSTPEGTTEHPGGSPANVAYGLARLGASTGLLTAVAGTHAEARHTFEDLVHLTAVVKLSDEDAEWLYPEKTTEETATHILKLGADLAVITKGSSGALLATPSTTLSIPAAKSTVVDTIGAGDSYMSAMILGLLTRGTDGYAPSVLEQLGRTAAAAAGITVSRAGARPPTGDELRSQLQR